MLLEVTYLIPHDLAPYEFGLHETVDWVRRNISELKQIRKPGLMPLHKFILVCAKQWTAADEAEETREYGQDQSPQPSVEDKRVFRELLYKPRYLKRTTMVDLVPNHIDQASQITFANGTSSASMATESNAGSQLMDQRPQVEQQGHQEEGQEVDDSSWFDQYVNYGEEDRATDG